MRPPGAEGLPERHVSAGARSALAGSRRAEPTPMARRGCSIAGGTDRCEGRGGRDAPPAGLRRRGLGGGSERLAPVHYPAGGGGRIGGERVVTGAKCGFRASGGKGIAKKIAREALVTAWYGAATTGLPPAAWSADADVGACEGAIRCRIAIHRDVARADAPPQARRATPNRRRARSNQTARRLPRGFLWPRGDRGNPRCS